MDGGKLRTLAAINYEHRSGPTKIDFQGTVVLPKAKGDATVESKRGRISIDVKFDHLEPPTKFGREYLTYVLWAITPQGRPKNLGEIVVGPSDKAKISVTTDLQALGLMVTAEPYYSVTAPSDVVVLENIVRPDTIGKVEEVAAKYDLLPRGQYTLNENPNQLRTVGTEAEALPYDRYEAVLELYQAQNAIQIARSLGADHFAADTLSKAEALLSEAQDMQARKQDTHMIVSRAREAAQTAEDARMITVKRRDEDRLSRDRQQNQDESVVRTEAQLSEERAAADRSAAEAERAAAEADRAAAERARREVPRSACDPPCPCGSGTGLGSTARSRQPASRFERHPAGARNASRTGYGGFGLDAGNQPPQSSAAGGVATGPDFVAHHNLSVADRAGRRLQR